jgi:molybdopterin molybdotransferase
MKLAPNSDLLSVAQAQERLLNNFHALEIQKIPLADATGRFLAEDIFAGIDLPPFANSSMDGFAVRSRDCQQATHDTPVHLHVQADIPAGQVSEITLKTDHAARIMTGAPIPEGADAVIPVEDTDFNFRQPGMPAPEIVSIYQPATAGQNVRLAASDVRQGEQIFAAGHRIRPQDVGFLSMIGLSSAPAHRSPRVALFSTGDELILPGTPLHPGRIYDANSPGLSALTHKYGGEALFLGIAPDREESVRQILTTAVNSRVDLIVSSAGVSVGAFDFVRSIVEQEGRLEFWRVNMRPGKPVAFGAYHGIPFIGLPGNPVSAIIAFEVFVRPALLKLQGARFWNPILQKGLLLEDIVSDGRESYLRAIADRQDSQIVVRLTGHQGSGNLRSLVQANALMVIPVGVKFLSSGDKVDIWMLEEL